MSPKVALQANSAVYLPFGLACGFFTEQLLGYTGIALATLKEKLVFQVGVQEIGLIVCFFSLIPIWMADTVQQKTLKNLSFAMGVVNALVLIEVCRYGLFLPAGLAVSALAACSFAGAGFSAPSLSAVKWGPLEIYQAAMVIGFGPLTYLFPETVAAPFLNLAEVTASPSALLAIRAVIVGIGLFKIGEGLVECAALASDDDEARSKFVRMALGFYGVQVGFDCCLLLASRLVGLSEYFAFISAFIAAVGIVCACQAVKK